MTGSSICGRGPRSCSLEESPEYSIWSFVNSLPDDKILDWFKLKAFADENFSISICDMVENIVRKGENAGYQLFSFSHNVFKSFPFQGP